THKRSCLANTRTILAARRMSDSTRHARTRSGPATSSAVARGSGWNVAKRRSDDAYPTSGVGASVATRSIWILDENLVRDLVGAGRGSRDRYHHDGVVPGSRPAK